METQKEEFLKDVSGSLILRKLKGNRPSQKATL